MGISFDYPKPNTLVEYLIQIVKGSSFYVLDSFAGSGTTGHAEGVKVTYDPDTVSMAEIYDMFMGTHDPTQLNRQGNDVGTQYRSAIFPLDDAQREEAEAAIDRWNESHDGEAVTTIESGEWYPAEDYHQEYWEGEGQRNPYCLAVIPPKLIKLRKRFADKVNG